MGLHRDELDALNTRLAEFVTAWFDILEDEARGGELLRSIGMNFDDPTEVALLLGARVAHVLAGPDAHERWKQHQQERASR